MSEKWRIYNFVTGEQYEPNEIKYPSEPTAAWVEGWLSCMVDGYKHNAYPEGTTEWNEYEDGWEDAMRD